MEKKVCTALWALPLVVAPLLCGPRVADAMAGCMGGQDLEIHVTTSGSNHAAMKLYVGIFGHGVGTDSCTLFMKILETCFRFDHRFEVTRQTLTQSPTKRSEITGLFERGFDAALFIGYEGPGMPVDWRLYDTKPGAMVCGKRYGIGGEMRDLVYGVASAVVKELLGQEPPFLTKIAFVEKDRPKRQSLLCMVDFDGSHYKTFYRSRRTLVAPIWSPDKDLPFVVVSEFTPSNVRFIGVDMAGKRYPVIDRDGTNVGLSYAGPAEVVYGRSGEIWHYRYNEKTKQGTHKRIVRGRGVCASPTLMPSGDVIFCCDGKIKRYNAAAGCTEIVVADGYCVGPSYSKAADAIVYSKRVRGLMQLCVYDMRTKQSTQVTSGPGDKIDPCWSPCGNYCAFCLQSGRQSRIALYSFALKDHWFLTPADKNCSCPTWSPRFESAVVI